MLCTTHKGTPTRKNREQGGDVSDKIFFNFNFDFLMFAAVALLCFVAGVFGAEPPFDGTIREASDGSLYAFMVPPFVSNHASSLEVLPDGTLVAAWFSGEAEEANKCAIVVATLPAKGAQWSNATVISMQDGFSDQNPVVFYDNKTRVLNVFHSHAPAMSGETQAQIWLVQSHDGGHSWGSPAPYITTPGAFPRNRIIPSLDGSLIFPYYSASEDSKTFNDDNYSILGKSDASHASFKPYPIKGSADLVQPTVVRLTPKEPGKLKAYFRDRRAESVYAATSTDEGVTWEIPSKTSLPNNNAGIEAFTLSSGRTAIVYNNKAGSGPRTPLTISLSENHGTTWPYTRNLQVKDDELLEGSSHVEYSYPSLLQTSDGMIHVTYTYDRLTIKYRAFTEEWVMSG